MTMLMVNINEAKAKLSEYLEAVAKGEKVLICKRNQPIAELRAVMPKRVEPRLIAGGPYHFDVPDSFFAAMPDEFLDAFETGSVYPESTPVPSRVAEAPAKYVAPRRRKPRR